MAQETKSEETLRVQALVAAKNDPLAVWSNPDVCNALLDEKEILKTTKMGADPMIHLSDKDRLNVLALEILAVAATVADPRDPKQVDKYLGELVVLLTTSDKAFINTTIAPAEDHLLDIHRTQHLLPKLITTVDDLAHAVIIMMEKGKKQEGAVPGTWRSCKRMGLGLRLMTTPKVRRKTVIDYVMSLKNANEVTSPLAGFSVNTLKNYFGYIGSVRLLRNCALWHKHIQVIKITNAKTNDEEEAKRDVPEIVIDSGKLREQHVALVAYSANKNKEAAEQEVEKRKEIPAQEFTGSD